MLAALIHQHFHYFPVQILQANVELQFRPSKEHAFALQAPIAKGWRRLYQNVSKVAGIFRSDGEPGWTWSWHLLHPDRSNHATHCKLKKLGVAFKFLLSARETSETAKIKWWACWVWNLLDLLVLSCAHVPSSAEKLMSHAEIRCWFYPPSVKGSWSAWHEASLASHPPKVGLEWLGKFGR